jgi:hypothetical protein
VRSQLEAQLAEARLHRGFVKNAMSAVRYAAAQSQRVACCPSNVYQI